MDKPIVSVIITTKNSSNTLKACLESIQDQTYKNIEIIVVDNDSSDSSKVLASNYTDKVYNIGPERSVQRNFGVIQSVGNYLLIIDSDMLLSKKVIESCVIKIQENKNIKGVVIPEESFGEGFWAKCKSLERSFYIGVEWMEAARFFEKNAFLKVGGFDESMVSGEDWDLSQKIEKEGKINRIDDFIYHNEGEISLFKTIKKKFYYASKFVKYVDNSQNKKKVAKQTGILNRYKLFLSKPKKLFKNPILGIGMLFTKTCEFFFGSLGYLVQKLKKRND